MDFRCSAARSRVALATAIVASAVALAGGAGGSSQDVPVTCELIYRAAVERAMGEAAGPKKIRASDEISGALAAWLVAERTKDEKFRVFALRRYDTFLGLRTDHDFHVSRPFGLLTLRLQRAGALAGERRARVIAQARERIAWFLDKRQFDEKYFDCNIALADTLAVACLARSFPDDPAIRAAEIRGAVAALGRRILETGDLNENASNYASLGICFFLELAKLEGWLDEVGKSPHFRNMFARMRDLISPVGSIPEYGDGYFEHRQIRLDFVLLLEMAARLYNDASFQDAARRFLGTAPQGLDEDQWHRGYMLLDLDPFAPMARTEPMLSGVQHRRVPGSPASVVPDKLILRTGSRPGDAMIMMDLYALGSHAHEYKRPSIGYYEVAGVPLFHNIGRRGTRSGQCGNSFWIHDRPEAFPGYPRTNAWNTMAVPADYCFPGQDPGSRKIGTSLLFRNFRTPEIQFLRLDNLRLEGPKGTLLLDGFESPKSWHSNVSRHPKVRLTSSHDHTQGKSSQEVNWNIFGEQYCTRLLEQEKSRDTTFRLTDYDTVKLDYKFDGQPPHCNLRALFEQWIDLGDRPLHCDVARAEARQFGGDAWGRVSFANYMGPGNSLARWLVLTREGALVIVDTFTAGRGTAGWAGGQLWQLYSMEERGDDWFASESDGAYAQPDGSTSERRMLIKFMKAPGLSIGAERVQPTTMHAPRADGSKHQVFFTAHSRGALVPGRRMVAAMAVLPLAADHDAARHAARVTFDDRARGGVTVTIASPDGKGQVIVGAGGDAVEIRRPDPPPRAPAEQGG